MVQSKPLWLWKKGELPASLHADELNPDIDFGDLNLQLAQQNTPLNKTEQARAAGISSFGFGGVNAHAVIEAPLPDGVETNNSSVETQNILSVSAKSEASLNALLEAYADGQKNGQTDFANLINQSRYHRAKHEYRAAVVSADGEAVCGRD